jgi:hypothetical protein
VAWTYDRIQREWLGGGRIAMAPDLVVSAFLRCEELLGNDWIERMKRGSTGTSPTLSVASVGTLLASISDLKDTAPLLAKIRNSDRSAFAELRAIYLLRRDTATSFVELEPTVTIAGRDRKCDFRIQRSDEPWVYVEVTQPDTSEAQARVQELLSSFADSVTSIKKAFTLEVFFRREPSDDEASHLLRTIPEFCSKARSEGEEAREEIPDGLGLLILNQQAASQVVLNDHGEAPIPRLGAAKVIVGGGEPSRHIVVRVPYADERAEQILTSEARQLPTDAPGLVMVEMGGVPGGFRSWPPIIERRFQPTMHTRVGAVCLFMSGQVGTADGEAIIFDGRLIVNKHARIALPTWVETTVQEIHNQWQGATRGSQT